MYSFEAFNYTASQAANQPVCCRLRTFTNAKAATKSTAQVNFITIINEHKSIVSSKTDVREPVPAP